MNTIITAFCTHESRIKTLRNIKALLMYDIMGLVCQLKAPGGSFRNLKFDLLYNIYVYIFIE